MQTIKPIETAYQGYRFRSRLEARWAVFFDALGIRYQYEPEGFELGGGRRYLPDFWLPDHAVWIEIKPELLNSEEELKLRRLAQHTGHSAYCFFGDVWVPPLERDYSALQFRYEPEGEPDYTDADGCPNVSFACRYHWCECPICGKIDLCEPDRTGCTEWMHPACLREYLLSLPAGTVPAPIFYDRDRTPRIQAAYVAARSARFEHGESGAPHA